MPQMSPLMWTTLFLFFSSILLFISAKSYFNSPLQIHQSAVKTTLTHAPKHIWLW